MEVYLSEQTIQKRVAELGAQITRDFAGRELVVVGVLNGSFMFVADLVRSIDLPITMDFIGASSYGDETKTSGEVTIIFDVFRDVADKDVLLVEDIVDTGLTVTRLMEYFASRSPRSVSLVSLLVKPKAIKHPVTVDYSAFEIENEFVVGYGLDYAGRYRELPYIGLLSQGG